MIVVHDGRAHADDFLASCVCHYKTGLPVFRLQADDYMLNDADTWVLDHGRRFEPQLHNFDHHQIEEEVCSFTMILDFLYGKQYRDYMPDLKYLEIFDSYGPKKAAEFAGVKEESIDLMSSPIHSSLLKAFSKIEGRVDDPFISIMKMMGHEICEQIESKKELLEILDKQARIFDYEGIGILDTTGCVMPDRMQHDHLPTKIWCKINKLNPSVILNIDSRGNGYRMVSINTDSLRFLLNDKSSFTHNSGFLTVFGILDDYKTILSRYVVKK